MPLQACDHACPTLRQHKDAHPRPMHPTPPRASTHAGSLRGMPGSSTSRACRSPGSSTPTSPSAASLPGRLARLHRRHDVPLDPLCQTLVRHHPRLCERSIVGRASLAFSALQYVDIDLRPWANTMRAFDVNLTKLEALGATCRPRRRAHRIVRLWPSCLRTRIVLSTAGPYALYSDLLVPPVSKTIRPVSISLEVWTGYGRSSTGSRESDPGNRVTVQCVCESAFGLACNEPSPVPRRRPHAEPRYRQAVLSHDCAQAG